MISRGKSSIFDNREYIMEYGYAVMNSIKTFSEELWDTIKKKRKETSEFAKAYDNDPQVQRDVEETCYPEREYEERQLDIINRTMLCMLFTYYDNALLYLAKQYGLVIPRRKSPRTIFNPLIDAGLITILREDRIFICDLLRYMRNVIIHGEKNEEEEKRAMKCIEELSLNITINQTVFKGIDIPFLQDAFERVIRVLIAIDDYLIVKNNNG